MEVRNYIVKAIIVILMVIRISIGQTSAQNNESSQDSAKQIIIENADLQEFILEEDPPIQKLFGNVRAFHEGAFFYADSAIIIDNQMFAYGDVTILQNDTTAIFGDSLKYFGNQKKAIVYGKVILENGLEKLSTPKLTYDLDNKVATYDNKAILENTDFTVKSKRGTYDTQLKTAYFYENVSVDGEDFNLITDSLHYNTESKVADWNSPTLINEDKTKIYSENGYYDLDDKNARFTKNAQFIDENSTTVGDTILYVDTSQLVTVIGNALYTTDSDTAKAEKITYSKLTQISTLEGNATYQSPDNFAEGDVIIYNKKKDSYNLIGRSMVSDPPVMIFGDDINYDKKVKSGLIVGNVTWRDTSANTDIICDSLIYRGEEDYARAIGFDLRPLMINYSDSDTLYLSADTLTNFSKINPVDSITVDTVSYLVGDNDVRIFSSKYQAIGDSLSYHKEDSIFTLMNNPIVWQDTTQMNGDTIWMHMKDGKLSSMNLRPNAMIINSTDLIFFNQIKGTKIDIDFKDQEIHQMKVNGNAQSIYYMLDDEDAYIGVNQTDCSLILFNFEEGKISNIRYYTEPNSKLLPMPTTDHEALKLKGFKWITSQRPLTYEGLRLKR